MNRKLHAQNSPKAVFFLTALLIIITILPLYYYPQVQQSLSYLRLSILPPPSSPSPPEQPQVKTPMKKTSGLLPKECNLFRGDWIPNPKEPYYTNETCWAIHEHLNCIKYGRPDTEYMRWRWKPEGCELPIFNPALFLDLVMDKSMAFVGDTVARNQMQSLMCLLSRVTYPLDVQKSTDERFTRFFYPKYNFTIANYWTPFLVRADPVEPNGNGAFHLHLDEPEPSWANEIEPFDYVIISSGQWFFRSNFFYQNNKLIGCHWCHNASIPDTTLYHGLRYAFRTSLAYLNNLTSYKGTTFVRTYAPSHFAKGDLDQEGDCKQTSPTRSNETRLEGLNLQMYMTQLEEFRRAEKEGAKKGLKYHLLDVTNAMLVRPDGHPSSYGHPSNATVQLPSDCVHWCLPGPIDTWSDFMLEILKRETLDVAATARAGRKVGVGSTN